MTKSHQSPGHRVVVVGAGYAGVLAANRILASRGRLRGEDPAQDCRVTVINPRDEFVERIRLHEVVAGTRPTAAVPLREVLHPDAEVLVGTVHEIDPAGRRVRVGVGPDTTVVPYDTLVYAVGSNTSRSVPGVEEHAHHAGDPVGAAELRQALAALAPASVVRVVGGGATAVEIASEIAAARPDLGVDVVSAGGVLGFMRPAARSRVLKTLDGLGVTWREDARVTRVGERELEIADGSVLGFDVCVWAASFEVPDLARRSGLATDAAGRLRVDATLTSLDHPDIVGAGDAVVAPPEVGSHLRMACAVALPLGGHAAATVLARMRGEELPTLSVGFAAQCMSLGRKAGYFQMVHADDTPRPIALAGRLGATAKEAICKMTVDKLRAERTRPGAYKTPKGPKPLARPLIEEEAR
ncbi:NAD(P)/FAD-dependent oxidoreductase [Prescottella agglutinans]|uniref:NADH dehydrogenase n=1 Tax=Prescottella agglutinans TaxID=1644129 RepID=A0ABT6MDE1_9NOCA|nr:FAD-dependent oxidoreductase [Prescottella agglutinans]MDH6282332.1 NADH dehydrogenase [Prescottella agglutinans]